MGTEAELALRLGRESGLLRSGDAVVAGVSRTALSRLTAHGDLVRVGRGVYQLPQAQRADRVAIMSATHPGVVVCLLSALAMHGLTTQSPRQAWIAIGNKAAVPRIDYPPLQVAHRNEVNLRDGVQDATLDGVTVRVTSPARTIAASSFVGASASTWRSKHCVQPGIPELSRWTNCGRRPRRRA